MRCPTNPTSVRRLGVILAVSLGAMVPSAVHATLVAFQNGTATFSQTHGGGPFSPDMAVDGDLSDPNGWAIYDGVATASEIAVWEMVGDVAAGDLTFKMHFLHFNSGHLLGRFRFSVTTDDRSTFADGLPTGGDVTANWTVLTNPQITGPAGMSFNVLPDSSILSVGPVANQGTYTVAYTTGVHGITGLRLEAMADPSLPQDGPGLHGFNGNFLLTEMTLDATLIPEPTGLVPAGVIVASLGARIRRRHG